MAKLLVIIVLVAVLVTWLVRNPADLEVAKFQKISTFLNVFVALLLGFFMSTSIHRWYSCVNGFLELLDAVRNLQMQLYALGAPMDTLDLCMRYGFLSAWLLNADLHVAARSETPEGWGK